MSRWCTIPLLFLCVNLSAQHGLDSTAMHYADMIDLHRLKAHLAVLTSDSLEGRETGQIGQVKAAQYISEQLQSFGLVPLHGAANCIQRYPLVEVLHKEGWLKLGSDTVHMLEDYYSFSFILDTLLYLNEFCFLGHGISDESYDNYRKHDMRGKAAVIAHGEPMDGEIYRLSGTMLPTSWSDGYDAKIELAASKGVSILFIVQNSFERNLPRIVKYMKRPKLRLKLPESDVMPVVFIGPAMADKIFGEGSWEVFSEKLKMGEELFEETYKTNAAFHLHKGVKRLWGDNVIAYIEGESLPEEYVFVTAHYDHLGRDGDEIFYGADDNGSGTSMVLELARVMAEAANQGYRPRRSVVFLFFSGEEKGLLGSEFYTDNPVVPLNSTIANLNVDMIGRRDANFDSDYPDYVYLIGSDKLSKELHTLSESMNSSYTNLLLDYKYNDPKDPQRLYYRSDHYNFAKNRIPVIFYFKGLHADYHRPTDTMDKLLYQSMMKVGKLIFHTTWELANREKRPEVDEEIR